MKEEIKPILVFLIVLMVFLIATSFYDLRKNIYLKENGIKTESQLIRQKREVNNTGGMYEPFLEPFFKYKGLYEFKTNDGIIHRVFYQSTDKDDVTEIKTLYYNPNKSGEYVWENDNPFSWLKEYALLGVECLFLIIIGFCIKKKK